MLPEWEVWAEDAAGVRLVASGLLLHHAHQLVVDLAGFRRVEFWVVRKGELP